MKRKRKPKIDPEFEALCRPLSDKEFAELETSILANGIRDAVVLWKGIIIDGHHRFKVASKHGLEYPTTHADERIQTRNDVKVWMLRNQLGRRNLSDMDRIELALVLEDQLAEQARQRMIAGRGKDGSGGRGRKRLEPGEKGTTRDAVAKLAGVSHGTLDYGKKVINQGSKRLREAVRSGSVAISTAADVSELPKRKQDSIIARGEKEVLAAAKEIRRRRAKERRAERYEKLIEVSANNVEISEGLGQYPVILVDVPWKYEHTVSVSRDIENHYPPMELEDIKRLPISKIATPDCMMFFWATAPKLSEAMQVLQAWGWDYRTGMVWDKEVIGPGYYVRTRHEHLLIAARGRPITPAEEDRPDSVLRSRRTNKHSEKPPIHRLIDKMYPGLPKIELFARESVKGWARWGNQAPKP